MRKLVIFVCLLAWGAARAQTNIPPGCGGTASETNACVDVVLEKVDHLLNRIYGIVIRELAAGTTDDRELFNSENKKTLIAAERAWVNFKDAQCRNEAALIAPGTAVPAIYGSCLIKLTNDRIQYLRRVAGQVHWTSKLCLENKATCELPTDRLR